MASTAGTGDAPVDSPPQGHGTTTEKTERQERAVQKAFAFLLRSTQHRPQTEAELAAKLRRRDVDEDTAGEALARARKAGAVDDAAFARAWVTDRGEQRGYGVARLRTELTRRAVPQALIEEALGQLGDRDEAGVATELARARVARMPAGVPPETVARRLAGYLARRGYAPALAQRVARSVSGLDGIWD